MVPEAREAVLDKLHEERGALKAAMTAYNRQARILDAVQGQEEESRARRHASEMDLREDLAEAEEEEKRLLEQLEAARAAGGGQAGAGGAGGGQWRGRRPAPAQDAAVEGCVRGGLV